MKKKLLALTAVVALAGVVMVGCGSKTKETEAATEAATTAVTESTEAATEAVSEAATTEAAE